MINDMLVDSETLYEGIQYKDPLSIRMELFEPTELLAELTLTEVDLERIDIFFFENYGTTKYTDFVLWYNNKGSIYDLEIDDVLELPSVQDIELFYIEHIV